MTHRPLFVAPILFGLLSACGGTVTVQDEDEDDGSGGATATGPVTSSGFTSGPVTSSSGIPVVASSGDVSSVDVVASTGSGGFGPQDLYPQYLGEPSSDRNLFALADNALGAQIFARATSNFGECEITRLTAPSGSLVYDGFVPSNGQSFWNQGVTSMVIPQLEHSESFPDVAPGTWSVKIGDFGNVNEISVLERQTIDGEFHGGVVDVNVFLVPGISDPDYIFSQIQNAFSDWAGIALGDVRFYDLGEEFFELDDFNYDAALDSTASAPPGQAITIMAVGSLGGSFADAGGFTLGAPADPVRRGSRLSAVTWRVYNDGFFDAIVVGHESGHYAGLSHTTEFENGAVDPLSDTPECPDIALGFETFDFSFCADYDYLMFPTGGSGAVTMSPYQQQIVQGSTVYRGIYQDGLPPAAPFQDVFDAEGIAARGGGRTLQLDGVGANATAPIAGPTPAALRRSLPAAVAALDGIGCGEGTPMADRLDAAARASTATELLALARDPRATPMLRGRALSAATRAAGASGIVDDLATLALDPALPEPVRESAIRGLDRVAPMKRASLAPVLRGDTSRLVRHLASK